MSGDGAEPMAPGRDNSSMLRIPACHTEARDPVGQTSTDPFQGQNSVWASSWQGPIRSWRGLGGGREWLVVSH